MCSATIRSTANLHRVARQAPKDTAYGRQTRVGENGHVPGDDDQDDFDRAVVLRERLLSITEELIDINDDDLGTILLYWIIYSRHQATGERTHEDTLRRADAEDRRPLASTVVPDAQTAAGRSRTVPAGGGRERSRSGRGSAETLMVIMRHKDFATTRKFYGAVKAAPPAAAEIHRLLACEPQHPAFLGD